MSGEVVSVWGRRFILGVAVACVMTLSAAAQSTQTSSRAVNEGTEALPANVPAPAGSSISANSKANYIIGPGDMLSINVFNEPEVTGKVPVRPDGMITIPLVGEVQASGITPDALQATITKKLTEFVKQPSVTVVVEEMNSRQFNVLGQVQHPGTFALNKPTRVLDALAQAGGFSEFAKTNKVYVLRHDSSGATVRLPFNYKRVTAGKDDQDDVQLQAGDTVIVP
jgi:polysaccharide export outer membrane protein